MIVAPFRHPAGSKNCAASKAGEQYGVLPWRKSKHGDKQVLLITSRTRGRWIVPKGWPMRDTAPYLAAAIEAFEEAGVIGEVSSRPVGSYRYLTEGDDGKDQHRHVTLFGLRVVGTLTEWPERSERKRRWLSLPEAADLADDRGLARIIGEFRDAPQSLAAGTTRAAEAALIS